MRDESHIKEIARVIIETLHADFENVKIIDVRIAEGSLFDDDDELRVEVIFEGAPKNIGAFSKVVRHVRPKLREIGENAFPVFSFTEDDEVGGKALAAS